MLMGCRPFVTLSAIHALVESNSTSVNPFSQGKGVGAYPYNGC